MTRVDLKEDFAVRTLRKQVRESLMSHGEQSIALLAYHPNRDQRHPRCPNCYDDDYSQGDTSRCTICYGTTFSGGIKAAHRVWTVYTDSPNDEKVQKRGTWQPVPRNVQVESPPSFTQHDFLVRVSGWTRDYRPESILEICMLDGPDETSLRTGAETAQNFSSLVGSKVRVVQLSRDHPIYQYNFDRPFTRIDGRPV